MRIVEPQVDQAALLFRINQEIGQASGLFQRTSLAGMDIIIDNLTFA